MDYIKGILWLACTTTLFSLSGRLFFRKSTFSGAYIYGYVFCSLFPAVSGILVQVLGLKWSVFFWTQTGWLIMLAAAIVLLLIYTPEKRILVKNWLKNNWFFILILLILLLIASLNYPAYWLANNLDDGYYISKIGSYPYLDSPVSVNFVSGLYESPGIDSYSLNTYELEASYYVYLFNIIPTVFCYCFLAVQNWMLAGCCLLYFGEKLVSLLHIQLKSSIYQYLAVLLLFFMMNPFYAEDLYLFSLRDAWQFITAMYYGSALVRYCGIFLLVFPVLDNWKMNKKTILSLVAVSVVLVSKSTVAAPLVLVSLISFALIYLYFGRRQTRAAVTAALTVFVCSGLIYLFIWYTKTGDDQLISSGPEFLISGLLSVSGIFGVLGIVWLSVRIPALRKLGSYILLMLLFLAVPFFSGITLLSSMYYFVVARNIAALLYFMTAVSWCSLLLWIFSLHFSIGQLVSFAFAVIFTVLSLHSITISGGDPFEGKNGLDLSKAWEVFMENPLYIPQRTRDLADSLANLALEMNEEEIYLLSPQLTFTENGGDYSRLMLRGLNSHVVNLSANYRYPVADASEIGFDVQSLNDVFAEYLEDPSEETVGRLENILSNSPVNAVLVEDSKYNESLNLLGYELYQVIHDRSEDFSQYLYIKIKL